MTDNQGLRKAAKLFGYLVWFIILVRVMFLSTDNPYTDSGSILGSHLGLAFWLAVLSLIPYFMARARAKKSGADISWSYVMTGATVIALVLAVGGFYGRSQTKQQPVVAESGSTADSSTPPTIQTPQESPQHADPRDAYLQLHVEQLNDDQYNAAVNRWLESHPEASSAESRNVMSQLLQEVYSQYPRSALGPALDMALQRGQRNASTPAVPAPMQQTASSETTQYRAIDGASPAAVSAENESFARMVREACKRNPGSSACGAK